MAVVPMKIRKVIIQAGAILLILWSLVNLHSTLFSCKEATPEPPANVPKPGVVIDWSSLVIHTELGGTDHSPDVTRFIKDSLIFAPQTMVSEWPEKEVKDISKGQNVKDTSQFGQSSAIDSILNEKRNGVFVSAGEWDGLTYSDTMYLARKRNWTGLLIEPNPVAFVELVKNRPESFKLSACLDSESRRMTYLAAGMYGGLVGNLFNTPEARQELRATVVKSYEIFCFRLDTILQSVGIGHIDLLVLDIENSELEVLRTFPFEKFTINMILVDFKVHDIHGFGSKDAKRTEQKFGEISEILERWGFQECTVFPRIPLKLSALDVLYVNKNVDDSILSHEGYMHYCTKHQPSDRS
ncbi:uncharacterized protein LOC106161223 isoform X2 [Lingula anatina]|nr:uncharacterized protein LOC106161223 isoform X2 [Lingula anatina]XP_023931314.1 uncharacterized protein LOC106161223 isoform X2 [Lingula anatina]|eukprot:XP_013393568.1 uncharacterized protein LOC106161223 isoform X2 [Lingula anatina]